MKTFNNSFEQLEYFCNYLIDKNRFVLDLVSKKFIDDLCLSAKKRSQLVKQGEIFWRARIGEGPKMKNNVIVQDLLSEEEMDSPPKECSLDGRANPRGMSYLYLAQDEQTAVAEVRPYINAAITLALFEICKDITVLNVFDSAFSIEEYSKLKKEGSVPSDIEEDLLWWGVNFYFSVPIKPNDIYYIPTQYLSELFKSEGYDGVLFGSSQLQSKYNLVLFDKTLASQKRRELKRVFEIDYITDPLVYHQRRMKNTKS